MICLRECVCSWFLFFPTHETGERNEHLLREPSLPGRPGDGPDRLRGKLVVSLLLLRMLLLLSALLCLLCSGLVLVLMLAAVLMVVVVVVLGLVVVYRFAVAFRGDVVDAVAVEDVATACVVVVVEEIALTRRYHLKMAAARRARTSLDGRLNTNKTTRCCSVDGDGYPANMPRSSFDFLPKYTCCLWTCYREKGGRDDLTRQQGGALL